MGSVVIKADASRVTVALGRFAMSLADKAELLEIIGLGQLKSIYTTFEESGSPSGSWPPLSEASRSWRKYSPGHKLLIQSGKTRNSIKSIVEGNSVVIGTGYRIAMIQFLGFDGTQSVKPYSYTRRIKSRDQYASFKITNKLGRGQTVKRKTHTGIAVVNVKAFTRHIRIPARNPLVFRPEDPERIRNEAQVWVDGKASAAGLEVR
jgi:phage gpG-like protein